MYRLVRNDLVKHNELELADEYETITQANTALADMVTPDERYSFSVKAIKKRGRPVKEATKVMRIPESLVEEIEALIAQHKKLN